MRHRSAALLRHAPLARLFRALLPTLLLTGCGDWGTGPKQPEAIDLDALFAPATSAEVAVIEDDWAGREPVAEGVVEESSSMVLMGGGLGTARVFSHIVDGHRHYGATLSPTDAAPGSLPVVVFLHGGDNGVSVDDVALILLLLGERTRDFVYVIPSFRAERLTAGGTTYTSEGEPSPWDGDVDDALALLDVALVHVPEADPERIGVLGASRGGTVGLLMAIRDPRIDMISELAAPTDFLGAWVRGLTENALQGELRPLPGIDVLNERFIEPMRFGSVTPAEFRLELVRRSPVLWADHLPSVQVHHGMADDVVPVEQGTMLIDALDSLDRAGHADEFYLYPDAGHDLLAFREIDSRIIAFLERL